MYHRSSPRVRTTLPLSLSLHVYSLPFSLSLPFAPDTSCRFAIVSSTEYTPLNKSISTDPSRRPRTTYPSALPLLPPFASLLLPRLGSRSAHVVVQRPVPRHPRVAFLLAGREVEIRSRREIPSPLIPARGVTTFAFASN